jgi:hypothetical protein
MKTIIAALISVVCVAGCETKVGGATTPSKELDQPVELNFTSPDLAVKSWWKLRDIKEAADASHCKAHQDLIKASKYLKQVREATTGLAQADQTTPYSCNVSTYSRDITSVKVESDTRAVVFATIKASTPIPAGVTPTNEQQVSRDRGFQYKYVLAREGKSWKVEQIYQPSVISAEMQPVFTEGSHAYVSSYVGGVQ